MGEYGRGYRKIEEWVIIEAHKQRFWDKVDKTGDCWEWTAAKTSSGYGNFIWFGKNVVAHRKSYELTKGEIPKGLDLDHLCRNRACVNPDHLEPVTRRENLLRGRTIPAGHLEKTHCPQGHEYTPENTYIYEKTNSRICITCRNKYSKRSYYRRKEREAV